MNNQNKIERAIEILNNNVSESQSSAYCSLDARSLLVTTLLYLILLLSLPLTRLANIILFGVYPVIASGFLQIPFGKVFLKSLLILPLVLLIGIFNPVLDKTPVFCIGTIIVTKGWITFSSLIIRGLFAFQAAIILIKHCGFAGFCHSLQRLGCPKFLTTQLLMVYRYISVLLQEALVMKRARAARGYGRKSFPMRMWGEFVGQLFIRTLDRSAKISAAMQARGYNGEIPYYTSSESNWKISDTLFLGIWGLILLLIRFMPDLSLLNFH